MNPLRGEPRSRAWGSMLGLVVLALAWDRAAAAADCLGPLGDHPGWSCSAELSSGTTVDYCLGLTNTFGGDAASRFFKMNVTGPFPRTCTCGAKGKVPGARYGEDAAYLCLDRETDTVETGKISKRKIAGQTFNASQNLRSKFTCKVDPTCDLPPVIDPDLPPGDGSVSLSADSTFELIGGGPVDLSYLAGCAGFASEAPDLVAHYPGDSLQLTFYFDPSVHPIEDTTFLIVPPSGVPQCDLYLGVGDNLVLGFPSPQIGLYKIYVGTDQPGEAVAGTIYVFR